MNSALNAPLQKLATLSADISPDVKTQCDLLIVAFKAVSDFIQSAASMSKPSDSQLPSVLNPCAVAIQKVVEYKDANRSSADFNHLAAIAESVSALGWIAMSGKPSSYIEEMLEAGKFYSNRILKDFKDKDEKRVQWVHALTDLWNQLKAYTSANYSSGLIWGSGGYPPVAPSPSSGRAAPPPPPPPCPEPSESSTRPTGPDTKALFAEINRGDAASRGLRKVKTQKNSEHSAGGVVSSGVKKTVAPAIPARPDQRKAVEQPKVEQIGNKWNVQYFVGNRDVIVEAKEKKETVYVYKCQDSCVKVKGKVNSIVLDSCKDTSLVFETVISTIDVINCQGIQVQVTGVMPTINIDKTDGCQVYLNEESKDVDIITAKSSEMNILVPVGDGDYTEYNVPEQFKTKFVVDHLETKVNDLS